jgi:hypothetical protein
MATERARITRLRRLALRANWRFHVARKPINFGAWPDRRYYAVDGTNTIADAWSDLDHAEAALLMATGQTGDC